MGIFFIQNLKKILYDAIKKWPASWYFLQTPLI